MTHLQKILWVVFTFAVTAVGLSLVMVTFQPHRFLFGIPLWLAFFAAMASVSLLTGSALLERIAEVAPETAARRGWLILMALMASSSVVGTVGASSHNFLPKNMMSALICSAAAFFLLVDCYQRAKDWPKLDLPELGGIPKSQDRTAARYSTGWLRFRKFSCLLSVSAYVVLGQGLFQCLGDRSIFDIFFISELGTGDHSNTFTITLICFGVLVLPFFLAFILEHSGPIPHESVRFSFGGILSVAGIIGIGVWDLFNPLHYFSLALWLWGLAIMLDQPICSQRGFINIRFPTWIVKLCMAGYVSSMIALAYNDSWRAVCVVFQRLVVLSTLAWLLCMLKVVAAESYGFGNLLNAKPDR